MISRPPLLSEAPRDTTESLEELLGLANAIEIEAVARYDQLARLMDHRGEPETAAVFREMREIEKRHVDTVAERASSLQQRIPSRDFTWRLPPEIGMSWDDVSNSSLLTPYRALAIAVTNEERAFALYSYVAAQAGEAAVGRLAETLAREELAHAAELRVRRRQAYRREQAKSVARAAAGIESLADFRALEARLEDEAGAIHLELADTLEAAGDSRNAALLADMARREDQTARRATSAAGGPTIPRAPQPDDAPPSAASLLRQALRPLEHASEVYEDIIARTDREELLNAAQAALCETIERMSALRKRIDEAGEGGLT